MELFKESGKCCGYGACMNSCSKNAISMAKDKYGFVFPEIDSSLCIECGLCSKVCAFQNVNETGSPLRVFAAARKDKTKIAKSASGGIFAVLAESMIEMGGVVFGSSMEYHDENLLPRHIAVSSRTDLVKLQGSKYVQSALGSSYKDVKKALNEGRKVLFSGTPCQIAGLKSFLGKDYENLITVDIICHGVPSADFFQSYIRSEEKKRNVRITDYVFRSKENGWGLNAAMKYRDKNGREGIIKFPYYKSSYFNMFIDAQTYRESCYNCKYTCEHRPGDITLGDFWGITVAHPEAVTENGGLLDMKTGISSVIINTQKGLDYFLKLDSQYDAVESTFADVARFNPQLTAPSKRGSLHGDIMERYSSGGYEAVEKYYAPFLRKKMIKQKIKKFIPRKLISKLKGH